MSCDMTIEDVLCLAQECDLEKLSSFWEIRRDNVYFGTDVYLEMDKISNEFWILEDMMIHLHWPIDFVIEQECDGLACEIERVWLDVKDCAPVNTKQKFNFVHLYKALVCIKRMIII